MIWQQANSLSWNRPAVIVVTAGHAFGLLLALTQDQPITVPISTTFSGAWETPTNLTWQTAN